MNRRAMLLGLIATPATAGPVRNPDDITIYRLTAEDRAALVWHASRGVLRHDDLGLSSSDAFESTSVLIEGRFLNENGTLSKKGWLALAGMEVSYE